MVGKKQSMEATVPSTPALAAGASVRRETRKKYTAEEKVRIELEGKREEGTIAQLCRREGIHPNLYYKWSKRFLEAGKQSMVGDTQREADSREVAGMKSELEQLASSRCPFGSSWWQS